MGRLLRILVGDPKCTRHEVALVNGKCDRCEREQVPGTRGRRATSPKPGQSAATGHAPYRCPHPGCSGMVRGGFCPRSDLHGPAR